MSYHSHLSVLTRIIPIPEIPSALPLLVVIDVGVGPWVDLEAVEVAEHVSHGDGVGVARQQLCALVDHA